MRLVALALLQVEVGEDLRACRTRSLLSTRLNASNALSALPISAYARTKSFFDGAVQHLLLLVVLRRLRDLEERLERLLEALQVEMDPAHLVHRVPVRDRLRELEDHLVAGLGVGELALLEVVVGEREVRLGDVLRVRIVLEQLVVDRSRLLHVLAALQRVPVVEERHVHLRVVAEGVVVGEALVGLHRLEQVRPWRCPRPSFDCGLSLRLLLRRLRLVDGDRGSAPSGASSRCCLA